MCVGMCMCVCVCVRVCRGGLCMCVWGCVCVCVCDATESNIFLRHHAFAETFNFVFQENTMLIATHLQSTSPQQPVVLQLP